VIDALLKADAEGHSANTALAVIDAGFVIKKKEFGLKRATREGAEEVIAEAKARVEQERAKLGRVHAVTRARMSAALRGSGDDDARSEAERLTSLVARFETIADTLVVLRDATAALELLLANSENPPNPNLWNVIAREFTSAIEEGLGKSRRPSAASITHSRMRAASSRFPSSSSRRNLIPERIPRALLRGRAAMDRTFALYYRIMARLALLADRAESTSAG
jgi:hypothetical protein